MTDGSPLHQTERITFDAYEDAPWRIERLKMTLAWAMGRSNGNLSAYQITRLYDHKGGLTVTWRSERDLDEWSVYLDLAWNVFAGEPCVSHEIARKD
jgi:hypothetical protein